MIVTYILALLLEVTPYPVFSFLNQFDTLEQCDQARKKINISDELKSKLGCLALAQESI